MNLKECLGKSMVSKTALSRNSYHSKQWIRKTELLSKEYDITDSYIRKGIFNTCNKLNDSLSILNNLGYHECIKSLKYAGIQIMSFYKDFGFYQDKPPKKFVEGEKDLVIQKRIIKSINALLDYAVD